MSQVIRSDFGSSDLKLMLVKFLTNSMMLMTKFVYQQQKLSVTSDTKKFHRNISSKKLLKFRVCLYVINYTRRHVVF